MRAIRKRAAPAALDEWRRERQEQNDPVLHPFNYASMRRNKTVLTQVENGLFSEQGGLCAYTGRQIVREERWGAGFHIEHLNAQDHCQDGGGEDCEYTNMVACWPAPNQRQNIEYGAVQKKNWPLPEERDQFVSPLQEDCGSRFSFIERKDPPREDRVSKWSNWVEAATPQDTSAVETIAHLKLNHPELRDLRWDAVFAALNPNDAGFLTLEQLTLLATGYAQAEADLEEGNDRILQPFCFAVRQALDRHIHSRQAQ